MWNQSLVIDVLADELRESLSVNAENESVVRLLKNALPSLTDEDALKVYQLASVLATPQNDESIEIVTTTPVSFHVKTRKTRPVIEELLEGAEKTILLTGYSIDLFGN